MTFADIPPGQDVFLDANTLVYHFSPHPTYGPACTSLVERIERQEIQGCTSSHALADVAHRLMTIEAMNHFGWPAASIAARLRKHRVEIPNPTVHQRAVGKLAQMGIRVVPVSEQLIVNATLLSAKFELLTGDALIVAVMRAQNLTHLASADADFDSVSGISRYSPA